MRLRLLLNLGPEIKGQRFLKNAELTKLVTIDFNFFDTIVIGFEFLILRSGADNLIYIHATRFMPYF